MQAARAAPSTRKVCPNTSSTDGPKPEVGPIPAMREVAQMAWRKKSEAGSAASSFDLVVASLRDAATRLLTGALELDSDGRIARIFLLDGAPYAVDLPGYTPRLASRMHAAGWIDAQQLESLTAEFPAASTVAGKVAVERGWIDAEQLGQLHQEYLLASIGGICDASASNVRSDTGATTDRLCTIPVDLEGLVQTLRLRAERAASTWASLGVAEDPSQVVFHAQSAVPEGMRLPEVLAVHETLETGRSADEVGEALGLTRAEATHILGALAGHGVVRHSWGVTPPSIGHLRVPEAFGDPARPGGSAQPALSGWQP